MTTLPTLARPNATPARPGTTLARPTTAITPAQASAKNSASWVTDVPVQGPTDEGQRELLCLWSQNHLFPFVGTAGSGCGGGCTTVVPTWSLNDKPCPTYRGPGSGYVAGLSFGGVGVPGFALAAASDPEIFTKLSTAQQTWVGAALSGLNDRVVKTTGTTCPGWAPAIGPSTTCFQGWYNLNYAHPNGPANPLRTDGVFDEDTLCALIGITSSFASDFPTAFPDPSKQHCQGAAAAVPAAVPAPAAAAPSAAAPAPTTAAVAPKGLSTGVKIGIGVAGATALGGIIYAATRKKKK